MSSPFSTTTFAPGTATSLSQTLIPHLLSRPHFSRLVTLNPEILISALQEGQQDRYFSEAICVADGIGLVWLYYIWHRKWLDRVPGVDLITACLGQNKYRFYCLGASESVNTSAIDALQKQYPGNKFDGHHGYFKDQDWPYICDKIKQFSPDFVLVGMGFPKQEELLLTLSKTLTCGIGIGVGGCFEIFAGTHQRAPAWMCALGIEWLYRLLCSPKRITRYRFLWRFFKLGVSPFLP